jgi:hypothetical protein
MSSLRPQDRVSLCRFTFADGRRCRLPLASGATPRGGHPQFCAYHAQKEARSFASRRLAQDLDYFFSGDYLSAGDLTIALARLIPAAVRGDLKPRTARTIAYMAQTLLQAIHVSEGEYINAFGTDAWRKTIRNSVNANHAHRFPPDPEPAPEQPQTSSAQPHSQAPTPAPAPSPAISPTPAPVPSSIHSSPTSQLSALNPQPQTQTIPSTNPLPASACPQPCLNSPNRDPRAVHFDSNYRLRESPKVS